MTENVYTTPGGTLGIGQINGTMGAADGLVIYTVPSGKRAELLGLVSDVVATATVGNRVITVKIKSGGVLDWIGASSGNTAATQTCGYDVCFGSCGAVSTTVRRDLADAANTNVQVREFCPFSRIKAGQTVTIDDLSNIDVADAVKYRLYYVEYVA